MMFSTKTRLPWAATLTISLVPFVLLAVIYLWGSYTRHQANPDDKIMPTVGKILEGAQRVSTPDKDGKVQILQDALATGKRFFIALAVVFAAIPLGVAMGCFPVWDAILYRFMVFFDKIPAISLLPILFIVFGLDELSKVALVVIGVFPTVCLDAYLRTKSIPEEQIQKSHTLEASGFETMWLVVFPQVFPRLLDTVRLNFKSMVALLLTGEALAATVGLGYRIFVVRRYMAMEVILTYVILMTVLLFLADMAFQYWIRRYRWIDKS